MNTVCNKSTGACAPLRFRPEYTLCEKCICEYISNLDSLCKTPWRCLGWGLVIYIYIPSLFNSHHPAHFNCVSWHHLSPKRYSLTLVLCSLLLTSCHHSDLDLLRNMRHWWCHRMGPWPLQMGGGEESEEPERCCVNLQNLHHLLLNLPRP